MESLDIYQSSRAYDLALDVLEFAGGLPYACCDLMSHKPFPYDGDAAILAAEAPRLIKAARELLAASMAHDPEGFLVNCWDVCRRELSGIVHSNDTWEINESYLFFGKMNTLCEQLMGW